MNLAVPAANSRLRFEILAEPAEIGQALRLVQQSFEREGYAGKSASGLRLTPYHLLPGTIVIAAKEGARIVASLSIIPRGPFGLPIEGSFAIDDFLRGAGETVEISALAVDVSARGQRGEVLYNLMKFMYHCNADLLGVRTEVIGVNPRMVPLYEAVLLFAPIPGTGIKTYDFANGAPVIPMHYSLEHGAAAYAGIYAGQPAPLNLMDFFLLPPPPNFALPSRRDLDALIPQRDPAKLREMLAWDPAVVRGLAPEKRDLLIAAYEPWPACAQVIREVLRG